MKKKFLGFLLTILSFFSISNCFAGDLYCEEDLSDSSHVKKRIVAPTVHEDPTIYRKTGAYYIALASRERNVVNFLTYTRIGIYNLYQQISLGDPTLAKTAKNHCVELTQEEEDLSLAYRESKVVVVNLVNKIEPFLKSTGFKVDYTYIFNSVTGDKLVQHIDLLIKSIKNKSHQ